MKTTLAILCLGTPIWHVGAAVTVPVGAADTPQLFFSVDHDKAQALGAVRQGSEW